MGTLLERFPIQNTTATASFETVSLLSFHLILEAAAKQISELQFLSMGIRFASFTFVGTTLGSIVRNAISSRG